MGSPIAIIQTTMKAVSFLPARLGGTNSRHPPAGVIGDIRLLVPEWLAAVS
jgi:hypothetical protein